MYNYFYKSIIILILVIFLYKQLHNFYRIDHFNLNLKEINFNVVKKGNSSLEIYWKKQNLNIVKYVIVLFYENDGPYFTVKDVKSTDNYFFHNIDNIQKDTEYRIAISAVDSDNNVTPITKLKKIVLSSLSDDIKVDYANYFKNNIICNPNGQHVIVGKCPSNLNNQSEIIALNNDEMFNKQKHTQLMNDISKKTNIKFKLKIL